MKRTVLMLLVLITAVILSACSATLGHGVHANAPATQQPEVIGAIAAGP